MLGLLIYFAASAGHPRQIEVSHIHVSLLSRGRWSYKTVFSYSHMSTGEEY